MEDRLKENRKHKAKKIAGLIVGLSLAQAGGMVVPEMNVLSIVQAAQQEVSSEELAQAVAETLAELDASVDKSVLNDLISQAQKLDTSGSDEAAVAQLQKVIASAVQVSNNESARQSAVDRHIQVLQAAASALYGKTETNTVYDGTYQINGALMHASADQGSMGNAALVKPFQLIKDGDNLYLRIECTPLTTKFGNKNFTGYLAEFYYYPGWTDEINPPAGASWSEQSQDDFSDNSVYEGEEETEENQTEATEEETTEEEAAEEETTVEEVPEAGAGGGIAATVESYYDNYDSYNDPQKGTDANVKGKKYPHYINIPVELNQSLLWTQVYVPVMESISAGGGRQYARLILDWNSLTQVSGVQKDKTALLTKISEAEARLASLKNNNEGFAGEQLEALSQVITTAKAVDANMNVDQGIVDRETDLLTKMINVFSSTKVDSDKSELKKALEVADTYLNEQDVTYSQASLENLRLAREKAQQVFDNEEASQTQVNLCVTAIDQAIQGLVIEGGDRRELKKALNSAETVLKDKDSYTAAAYQALKNAYDQAKSVYSDSEADQASIDDQTEALNYVIKNMKKVSETKVDKSGLYDMIKTATGLAAREDLYTADSIKALKSALEGAETVYQKEDATQSEVNAQSSALSKAVAGLSAKPSSGNSSNNNNNNNSSSDSNSSDSSSGNLDINNLADGVYSVTGTMLKTDKTSASMSNDAINHTIKLTVKSGKYTLTLDFKGLTINDQLGYLGKLKYYKTGYTLDKYGSPKGSLGNVTIESYQKYENGKKVSDSFGSDYPDVVSFPMIAEAKNDGYVPLQVFVPIMDSISKGSGTQPVFLKLDWSSLKKTNSNDSSFKDTTTNTKSTTGTSGSSTNGSTGTTNLNTMSTNSKLGGSSLGGTNSSLKTNSSLAGGSSLKTSGTTSLKSGKSLTADAKKNESKNSKTLLESAAAVSSKDSSLTGTGSVSDKSSSESKKDISKVMVPSVISALAALAGLLYKLKSRMGI